MRGQREYAARYFQADVAVDAGGNPDRAAAVGRMRDRDSAGCDHGGAAGRRSAGGVVGIPGVARDVHGGIFRRAADPEFRRGGAPDQIEACSAHLPGQERIGRGAIAAHDQRAHFLQAALHGGPQILHQERQTGKGAIEIGAVPGRIGDRILEHFDHARQRRIDPGDAGRCLRRQFRGRQFALADPRRQRNPVMVSPFIPAHRQIHFNPSSRRSFVPAHGMLSLIAHALSNLDEPRPRAAGD